MATVSPMTPVIAGDRDRLQRAEFRFCSSTPSPQPLRNPLSIPRKVTIIEKN